MEISFIDYCKRYHPTKSVQNVRRLADSGKLPSNHIVKRAGRNRYVTIKSDMIISDELIFAAIEYHRLNISGCKNYELAARLAIEMNVNSPLLNRIIGLSK